MQKFLFLTTCLIAFLGINACNNNADSEAVASATVAAPNAVQGKELFQQICSSCHGLSAADGKDNAPILADIKTKWPDAIALNAFVKNAPAEMQKTEHAKALYEQWKTQIQMPPYIGMSEKEIADVVAYLYEL